ncbi:transposase, partial [Patescibacteria group bacterium AH-259-L07]|nr:transposase [Patescibacteria group bacterium AH-259-L07]
MKTVIQVYHNLVQVVKFFYKQLKLDTFEKTKGRKLAISIINTISLALFKQVHNIATKKSIYKIFRPPCSYKTLVVNMNRFAPLALLVLVTILKINRTNQHLVKHTDSTDIPVCSNRKAKYHQTMKGLATWGHTGKGSFFGLKMHITTDLNRKLLAVKFTSGNGDDREVFLELNKDLLGLFIADAGYISQTLHDDFCIEGMRLLLVKPRKNMKKIMTQFQGFLYNTRMLIELNFRSLKLFYGMVTSLPRSVDGYLAHYIYALLA